MNMMQYDPNPDKVIDVNGSSLAVFDPGQNIDRNTVESFGDEWSLFDSFDEDELQRIGKMYFPILLPHLTRQTNLLDAGCGTGRWSKFLSSYVGFIEAIDPSIAVFSAQKLLKEVKNVRVTQAGIGNIPFADNAFDAWRRILCLSLLLPRQSRPSVSWLIQCK